MWFGAAAFGFKSLVLPFKTSSYEVGDLMRFDLSFKEQCQTLIGIWGLLAVLFTFASGKALTVDLGTFWCFVHTTNAWGMFVRNTFFSSTMMLILFGLCLTSPKAENARKYSERRARRTRRLARMADSIRVTLKSSRRGEWGPGLRYYLVFLCILLNSSPAIYLWWLSDPT